MFASYAVLRRLLAVTFMGALVGGCAGSNSKGQSTEPLDESMEPAQSAPSLSSDTPRRAFDADGNPYMPGSTILLDRTFYFEYDQSVIKPEAFPALEAHARMLIEHPDRRVTIEGHADERGTRDYNLALGERRAQAVRLFLVSAGVPTRQIETVSYGEERPEDSRHADSAWSRNRRAAMVYRGTDTVASTR
jgi:peptidoglycan-associated lipoprotein